MKRKGHTLIFELLGLGALLKQCPKGLLEIAKLKSTIYYLRLVRGVRGGYIILFQIFFCVLFMVFGMVFVHAALFLFLIHGSQSMAWALLAIGAIELISTALFMGWFLSAKRWLEEAARINPEVEKLLLAQKQTRL